MLSLTSLVRGGAAATFGLVLVGCSSGPLASGPVELSTPSAKHSAACAALAGDVPGTLLKHAALEVEPAEAGAAWGDPAIVLTCDVPMPDDFDQGSSCEEINGVGWYVPMDQFADLREDLTVYTIGRTPVVRLAIPSEYRREPAFVADSLATLAAPVKSDTKLEEPCI